MLVCTTLTVYLDTQKAELGEYRWASLVISSYSKSMEFLTGKLLMQGSIIFSSSMKQKGAVGEGWLVTTNGAGKARTIFMEKARTKETH